MSTSTGFDYNEWRALNQQQLAATGTAEADTPETSTQGGVDQAVQHFFRLFGLNPDLKGHAVVSDTNVGGGLSLQNAAVIKDRPGGIIASVLRYFARALPPGLAGAEGVTGDAPSAADGEFSGGVAGTSAPGDMPTAAMPVAVHQVIGTLPASDPVDIPIDRLSYLSPSATPDLTQRGVEVGIAA